MSSSESPPPSPPPFLFDGPGVPPAPGPSPVSPPVAASNYPLEEEFWETDSARLRRWLPWLNLFQAFRLAMDYRKLTLGLVAVVALALGEWAFSLLPFAPATFRTSWPWEEVGYAHVEDGPAFVEPGAPLASGSILGRLPFVDFQVVRPYRDFFNAGWPLVNSSGTISTTAMSWTRLLWLLFVCGLCGGTIARLAALNFAGKDCSLGAAFMYCAKRILSLMGGPLLPVVAIGLLWLLCALGGLVGSIPYLGTWFAAVLWFIPLTFGLMMAIILLGVAAGWPLMYATVSTEGSDAFDGLSRSYSYLFSRPWYALWLLLLASVYGSILAMFLSVVIDLGTRCAFWGVHSGAGEVGLKTIAPSEYPSVSGEVTHVPGAGLVTEFWMNLVRTARPAFLFSYFWTAVTIAYLLLRKSVDATPLDAVDEDLPPPADGDFPLVGVPAVERREAAATAAAPPVAAPPAAEASAADPTALPPSPPPTP